MPLGRSGSPEITLDGFYVRVKPRRKTSGPTVPSHTSSIGSMVRMGGNSFLSRPERQTTFVSVSFVPSLPISTTEIDKVNSGVPDPRHGVSVRSLPSDTRLQCPYHVRSGVPGTRRPYAHRTGGRVDVPFPAQGDVQEGS